MIRAKSLHHRTPLKGLTPSTLLTSRPASDRYQTDDSAKKRLNVDSPSFTPSSLAVNGQASKPSGLSPKAANAAPFKPKGISSGTFLHKTANTYPRNSHATIAVTAPAFTPSLKQYNPNAPDWVASAPDIPEFLPQSYNTLPTVSLAIPLAALICLIPAI